MRIAKQNKQSVQTMRARVSSVKKARAIPALFLCLLDMEIKKVLGMNLFSYVWSWWTSGRAPASRAGGPGLKSHFAPVVESYH